LKSLLPFLSRLPHPMPTRQLRGKDGASPIRD
jgi:hypothetical protein